MRFRPICEAFGSAAAAARHVGVSANLARYWRKVDNVPRWNYNKVISGLRSRSARVALKKRGFDADTLLDEVCVVVPPVEEFIRDDD